jgi:hypothetical protein
MVKVDMNMVNVHLAMEKASVKMVNVSRDRIQGHDAYIIGHVKSPTRHGKWPHGMAKSLCIVYKSLKTR